jgi:hypothetical protein
MEETPLGALIVQRQLLRLLEHVCYVSRRSTDDKECGFLPLQGFKTQFAVLGSSTLSAVSHLAASQLESIEASADFLKFKITAHHDLSLSLKATAIRLATIAFVAGDSSNSHLPSLVKSILIDPAQMMHDELGPACLDCVAAISMNCPEYTADLNRALRNHVVHTHGSYSSQHISSRVIIAAKRLAWCLSAVSNDKVVSTLYSLVNVLTSSSTSSSSERGSPLRPKTALSMMNFDQKTVASSISLTLKSEDQKQQVFSNVIEAIAEMVSELQDEKIAELMISLLAQKFGRVNDGVDKFLVWGLAKIATVVKEKDFRRILKVHSKARTDPSTASESLTETV